MPIINLGYKTDIDFTYSIFQGYPKVGNIYVYVVDYFLGGENLVLGYHYYGSNNGAQLKLKFGTPGLAFRKCSGGSWGAWTTIVS